MTFFQNMQSHGPRDPYVDGNVFAPYQI